MGLKWMMRVGTLFECRPLCSQEDYEVQDEDEDEEAVRSDTQIRGSIHTVPASSLTSRSHLGPRAG